MWVTNRRRLHKQRNPPTDERASGDRPEPTRVRQDLLNQNKSREQCDPDQIHHAQHEQQQHQQPATTHAVKPVPNAHRKRSTHAFAPMRSDERGRIAALDEARLLNGVSSNTPAASNKPPPRTGLAATMSGDTR